MNSGSCLCGSIRYEISSELTDQCYCHCSVCRKLTGSAAGAYGTVSMSNFNWTSGEALLSKYQQTKYSQRLFCSRCGSFLASIHSLSPSKIYVTLGCMEKGTALAIEYQQFLGNKASWSSPITDVEGYDTWPDWIQERIEHDA